MLRANQYADQKADGLQRQICEQSVWNATQEGVIRCQAQQLAQLYSMTRLTIPNGSVSPGWGDVAVFPVPPIPPVPPTVTETVTIGGTRQAKA